MFTFSPRGTTRARPRHMDVDLLHNNQSLACRHRLSLFEAVEMSAVGRNPVWNVYNRLRTARLNVLYYTCLLKKREQLNFFIELVIAITTTSSVAALSLWSTDVGKQLWQFLAITAAFISVVKPLLNLPDSIKRFQSTVSGYSLLEYDLRQLTDQISNYASYGQPEREEYERIVKRERDLATNPPVTGEDRKLKQRFEKMVNEQLPSSSFFIPP